MFRVQTVYRPLVCLFLPLRRFSQPPQETEDYRNAGRAPPGRVVYSGSDASRNGKGAKTGMKNETFKVDEIYVPTKRRKTLDMAVVNEIAESMLEEGQRTPILVRQGKERFVLVEGLHRLEACKALGEENIVGLIVQARRH